MPNWTYNNVQFIGKTEDSVKKLKELLKSKDNDFDFNNIIPIPLALTETVSGSENAKPDWIDPKLNDNRHEYRNRDQHDRNRIYETAQ